MPPGHQVALHLVGRVKGQGIAFLALGHRLQLLKQLFEQLAIVTKAHAFLGEGDGLGLLLKFLGGCHIEGPVDIQLLVAHQVEMIPQRLFEVGIVVELRHLRLHHTDDFLGTVLALGLVCQTDSVIHHLLNLPTVFRHQELLTMGVVV